MFVSFLLPVIGMSCHTSTAAFSCDVLDAYEIHVETKQSPLHFAWIGEDADGVSVLDRSGASIWEIQYDRTEESESQKKITSPVVYGTNPQQEESIDVVLDTGPLVTGAEYVVQIEWFCFDNNANIYQHIEQLFEAP